MRLAAIALLAAGMLSCARAEASRQPVEVEMHNRSRSRRAEVMRPRSDGGGISVAPRSELDFAAWIILSGTND